MARCPRCFYILAYKGSRKQYLKCAKCGRNYKRQEIEDRDFRKESPMENNPLTRTQQYRIDSNESIITVRTNNKEKVIWYAEIEGKTVSEFCRDAINYYIKAREIFGLEMDSKLKKWL